MSEPSPSFDLIEAGGLRLPLDPTVITPGIHKALRLDAYEGARRKCLFAMIEPRDRIVEVGGGIGFLSALMALNSKPELVVSIDGHPAVKAYSEDLHRLNGVPHIISLTALVVTEKTSASEPFYLSADFWGSSMVPGVKNQTGVVQVPVVTFGELIAEYHPTMLVIDLEVMREYVRPGTGSPIEAMDLTGIDKVVVHLPIHLAGQRGIKRVFDFFSAQDFYYNIDHSRLAVILFSRIQP